MKSLTGSAKYKIPESTFGCGAELVGTFQAGGRTVSFHKTNGSIQITYSLDIEQ